MILRIRPDPDISKFLNEISRHPVLNRADELALVLQARQGSEAAARKLCAHNLKFVISVAARFQGAGLPLVDLVHEGVIGLMIAIRRFDPSAGYKLISYATWWIRRSITKAISETARTIRVSVEHEAPIARLKRTPLRQFIGGMWLEDVETFKSSVKGEYLEYSLDAFRGPLPLDQPIDRDGNTRADTIPSPGPQADQLTGEREGADIINRLRGKLPDPHRMVITLLFGLDGAAPRTLREIGVMISLSSERVRQIKEEALRLMRKHGKQYRD